MPVRKKDPRSVAATGVRRLPRPLGIQFDRLFGCGRDKRRVHVNAGSGRTVGQGRREHGLFKLAKPVFHAVGFLPDGDSVVPFASRFAAANQGILVVGFDAKTSATLTR